MSAADVLVLGGPASGKTHYAGQLLGRLRNDRQGILRVRAGGEDDLRQFEEVLACLEEGRSAGHTPGATWTRMKCQLQLREGDDISLEWPDYAGERLESVVVNRELTAEWASVDLSRGSMVVLHPPVDTQTSRRPVHETAGPRFQAPSGGCRRPRRLCLGRPSQLRRNIADAALHCWSVDVQARSCPTTCGCVLVLGRA